LLCHDLGIPQIYISSGTEIVTPLFAQQQNQTNAITTASNTTQQQIQTEAGGGGAGRVEPQP